MEALGIGIALVGLILALVIPEVRRFIGLEQSPPVAAPALERIQSARFSFSFAYPVTWDRHDPINGDGYQFLDPKDSRVSVAAWGSHAHRSYDEFYEYAEKLKKDVDRSGSKILDSRPHGLHTFSWLKEDGDLVETREDIPGLRLKRQLHISGTKYISQEVRAFYDGIEYGICFQAPSSEFKKYEDLALILVSSLRVLKRNGKAT
jgi:hypothetical protein